MSLNKRSICNLWRQWTPWELFPFLITSHLATVHQHLQGLCYHRLQGLHNLKITHKKQDNIFIRQGTTGRARLQMTVLVTKIWVEFNYLKTVHVAAICISKLLKYQHLHSPFQRLHRPTSEAYILFTHIAAQIQEGEAHLFFAYFSDLSCPLWTEIMRNAATNSQRSWMLREASQLCWHGTTLAEGSKHNS